MRKKIIAFLLIVTLALTVLSAASSPLQFGPMIGSTGSFSMETVKNMQTRSFGAEARFNAAFLTLTADLSARADLGELCMFASAGIRKTFGFLETSTGLGLRLALGSTEGVGFTFNGRAGSRFFGSLLTETLNVRAEIGFLLGAWDLSMSARIPIGRVVDGLTGRHTPAEEWNGQFTFSLLRSL